MRKLILILPAAAALTGCGSNAPDFGPIGAGLSVIGLGIVINMAQSIAPKEGRHHERNHQQRQRPESCIPNAGRRRGTLHCSASRANHSVHAAKGIGRAR